MSVSRKRRARALRALLGVCVDFSFSREAIDAMLLGPPGQLLAASIRYHDCDDARDAHVRWLSSGHSGSGIYVHCLEYPEDGCSFAPMSWSDAIALQVRR